MIPNYLSILEVELPLTLSLTLSEDLWVVRREEQRTKVARVGLAQLQAAERRVEQRCHFGGEAATVQARIRRLVRVRVRVRVRGGVEGTLGAGAGAGAGVRCQG